MKRITIPAVLMLVVSFGCGTSESESEPGHSPSGDPDVSHGEHHAGLANQIILGVRGTFEGYERRFALNLGTGEFTVASSAGWGRYWDDRGQADEEQVDAGLVLYWTDPGAFVAALEADSEFDNDRTGRQCQVYTTLQPLGGGAYSVLCDDTTYSPLSERFRDFMYPFLEEIPPPP
ncbi:MAG: hypothetical protein AAGA56_28140 [Myxococcota bacterium]